MLVSKADHERIAEAVAKAESSANGEIVCVLARRSSDYRETPLVWACAAALVLPLALIPLGFNPTWLPFLGDSWVENGATDAATVLIAYAVAQGAVLLAMLGLCSIPVVRRLLTPASVRRHRVHEAALEQFMTRGLHLDGGRVGVLVYASLAERQVQILADRTIGAKVDQSIWKDAVAALTGGLKARKPGDGFVAAVEICGRVMAEHFPATGENPNDLSNDLVEI